MTRRSNVRASLRAYPTLLKVGFAESVAYRAEALVWMLTNTMPLVNLALWSAVARSGPIGQMAGAMGGAGGSSGGYGQKDLVAYFLAALVVRQLTGSWVLWEMSDEIRRGVLSMRLLRPIHPLLAYSAENLSALPMRAGFVVPVAIVALVVAGPQRLAHDPLAWVILVPALLGAWLINFFANSMMGTLSFFLEQSYAVFQLWLAAYFVLSGYLFPLDFLRTRAPWVMDAIRRLPFYSMAGFPIEVLLGLRSRSEALGSLAVEWGYVVLFAAGTLALWRTGIRRYNAYGA